MLSVLGGQGWGGVGRRGGALVDALSALLLAVGAGVVDVFTAVHHQREPEGGEAATHRTRDVSISSRDASILRVTST